MAPMTAEEMSAWVLARLNARPIQSSGKVIESGSNWVSKSIAVRAIIAQIRMKALAPCGVGPKCHAA